MIHIYESYNTIMGIVYDLKSYGNSLICLISMSSLPSLSDTYVSSIQHIPLIKNFLILALFNCFGLIIFSQAFHLFDSDRSSFVVLEDFRKVVENFVFPLTRSQFDELIKKIDGVSNHRLNYNQFMFKIKKGGLTRETPTMGRVTPANNTLDNVVSKLQQKVTLKFILQLLRVLLLSGAIASSLKNNA